MFRIYKSLLTAAAVVTVATVGWSQVETQHQQLFCNCSVNYVYDNDLPLSHPTNRCAIQQNPDVSWGRWLSNNRGDSQFHFLDLLELLSRFHNQAAFIQQAQADAERAPK